MDRWTAEGGRTRTIYTECYTAIFWVGLACLTLGWARVRDWLKAPAMGAAEALTSAAMIAWVAGLLIFILAWTPPE